MNQLNIFTILNRIDAKLNMLKEEHIKQCNLSNIGKQIERTVICESSWENWIATKNIKRKEGA